jgi:AhpD family alkylhydroperoxidase
MPPQRESIALLVSQTNECQYCLSAHTLTAGKAGLSREQVLEARAGRSEEPLQDAILAFAREALKQRGQGSDAELEAAHTAGLDDGLLMEIIANIALMTVTNYSNRLADPTIDFPVVQTQL